MPSVSSATLAAVVPLTGSNMESRAIPEGAVVRDGRAGSMVYFNVVSAKFFASTRIPCFPQEYDGVDATGGAQAREVADVFEVPLEHFLIEVNHQISSREYQGRQLTVVFHESSERSRVGCIVDPTRWTI